MRLRTATLASVLFMLPLAGCEGLRDALTAHTETVARAEDKELTATRLGDLVGQSQAPLRRDVVSAVANIWVSYQLLALASARGDTLSEPAVVDSAMWSMLGSSKARQYYERVSRGWNRVDTAGAPALFASGDLLSASHILLMTQGQPDSVKRAKLARIRGLRARVTPANFAQLARENSEDGSAQQGGSLGVFGRGDMVAPFERAVLATRPGSIADGIVETQFGYHIIYRPTFEQVRASFLEASGRRSAARAESTFAARLDSTGRIELKRGAAVKARAAALEADAHREDRATLASSRAGNFTVGRFVRWLETFPPQQQIPQRIQNAPDSAVEGLIRNFVRNELILRAADSAGIRVPQDELLRIRTQFAQGLQQTLARLRIHPSMLTDSARTPAEREALASRRVEKYLEDMIADRVPFVPVPPPLESALRSRFDSRINSAGLDRALQLATQVRARTDTTRAQQQPPSVVPMPGDQPAPGDTAAR